MGGSSRSSRSRSSKRSFTYGQWRRLMRKRLKTLEIIKTGAVEVERQRAEYFTEASVSEAEAGEKMCKVVDKASHLDEFVLKALRILAKNREKHTATVNLLVKFVETDPEVREEMKTLETECDEILKTVTAIHREFYHFGRLFNAKDIENRTEELVAQTEGLEQTLEESEQPEKDNDTFDQAVRAIRALGRGRGEEATELVDRLRKTAASQ